MVPTRNGRKREVSTCRVCQGEKSRFLGYKWTGTKKERFILPSNNTTIAYNPCSAFKPCLPTIDERSEIYEENSRLSNLIAHQWRIDHIPGYYESFKRRKQEETDLTDAKNEVEKNIN